MNGASASRKAALWVGLVFLLGAALGGVLGYVFAHRSYAASTAPVNDQTKRAQHVRELTQELELTSAQQQQLDHIIADIQTEFRNIRKQTDPQIDEARQKGRERIRAILTPEQRPKFEDFLKRLDEKRRRNSSQ